jgi:hypothetical protein
LKIEANRTIEDVEAILLRIDNRCDRGMNGWKIEEIGESLALLSRAWDKYWPTRIA